MPRYTLTCTWTTWGGLGSGHNPHPVPPDQRVQAARGKAGDHGVQVHSWARTNNGGVWDVEGADSAINAMIHDWLHPPSGHANVDVDPPRVPPSS
jgi:hypothetical protein